MEEIVEPTSPAQTRANSRIHSRAHTRTNTGSASFANFSIPERQPLLARATAALQNRNQEQHALGPVDKDKPVAGGTMLGIHNLAIVFPQFAVCFFYRSIPPIRAQATKRVFARSRSLPASSSRSSMEVTRTRKRPTTVGMALRGS